MTTRSGSNTTYLTITGGQMPWYISPSFFSRSTLRVAPIGRSRLELMKCGLQSDKLLLFPALLCQLSSPAHGSVHQRREHGRLDIRLHRRQLVSLALQFRDQFFQGLPLAHQPQQCFSVKVSVVSSFIRQGTKRLEILIAFCLRCRKFFPEPITLTLQFAAL
jgi:hypothetical protein